MDSAWETGYDGGEKEKTHRKGDCGRRGRKPVMLSEVTQAFAIKWELVRRHLVIVVSCRPSD